jgi:hypothetical protein
MNTKIPEGGVLLYYDRIDKKWECSNLKKNKINIKIMIEISNEQILESLLESVSKMSISSLHKALMGLDQERYSKVLNLLKPDKFLKLVEYDLENEEYSRIWQTGRYLNLGIKKELLDVLPPNLLIHIASKCSADIASAWGKWSDGLENDKGNILIYNDLTSYLYFSTPERVAEIINFLVGSCMSVKAPISERGRNIFSYNKKTEFPFEVICLFACVHPWVFFPALNLVKPEFIDKMFWLCRKFLGENENFENIFQSEYLKDFSFEIESFECIGKHIGVLKNQHLIKFLNSFGIDEQSVVLPFIGKDRIVELHKSGISIGSISIPADWKLFKDKQSNEFVLGKVKEEGQAVLSKLSTVKKIQLLGSLV